jgi:arginyl-tRNA synthetase
MTSASAIDPRSLLAQLLAQAVAAAIPEQRGAAIVLERPRQAGHGDYASNLALQLAKPLKRNPREIAQALVRALPPSPWLAKAEAAGAGFINLFLTPAAKQRAVHEILAQGERYGRGDLGAGKKVQVEFVSANPTGPLHVGHGRGAAFGASLANVLDAAGFAVSREYYVNDAGRQMDILALSTWLRYLQLNGLTVPFPPKGYQGEYVRAMAQSIAQAHGRRYVHAPSAVLDGVVPAEQDAEAQLDGLIANAKKVLGADYAYVHDFALTEQLGDCRNDLLEFGVTFDHWFSERSLHDGGQVDRAIASLEQGGYLYVQDGARWFRSTAFGDEKDRVVQRENGQYTYFASDIAYHLNKFERGFEMVVDVWGADHHGHVPRVKAALQALGRDSALLTIALVQFVTLYRDGKQASMSTRSAEYVTLRELRNEVGNDAARFFYLLRKKDQHLDFDLDLAKSQSNDNPVYYVQYAHARICSVQEQWGGDEAELLSADLGGLESEQELQIMRLLMEYPAVIEDAARDLAPHLVAFYLKDLAADFHSYYNSTHFLVDDRRLKLARLALIRAVRHALANGLKLLGVSTPAKM